MHDVRAPVGYQWQKLTKSWRRTTTCSGAASSFRKPPTIAHPTAREQAQHPPPSAALYPIRPPEIDCPMH